MYVRGVHLCILAGTRSFPKRNIPCDFGAKKRPKFSEALRYEDFEKVGCRSQRIG